MAALKEFEILENKTYGIGLKELGNLKTLQRINSVRHRNNAKTIELEL